MKKISIVIALVIVLSCFSFLSAQEERYLDPYPFSGHLLDSSGNPIVGLEITLTNQRTGDILSMLSAEKGEFTFTLNNFKNKIPYEKGDKIIVMVDNKEAIMVVDGQYMAKDIIANDNSLSLGERTIFEVEENTQTNTKLGHSGSIVFIGAVFLLALMFVKRRRKNV